MDKLKKFLLIEKIRNHASYVRHFLDRHMVFITLIVLVFFGTAILGVQQDSNEILEGQAEQRAGRSQAVIDLKNEIVSQRKVISRQNDRIEDLSEKTNNLATRIDCLVVLHIQGETNTARCFDDLETRTVEPTEPQEQREQQEQRQEREQAREENEEPVGEEGSFVGGLIGGLLDRIGL